MHSISNCEHISNFLDLFLKLCVICNFNTCINIMYYILAPDRSNTNTNETTLKQISLSTHENKINPAEETIRTPIILTPKRHLSEVEVLEILKYFVYNIYMLYNLIIHCDYIRAI